MKVWYSRVGEWVKWVVSGNEGINRVRGICDFLSVCLCLVYSTG